MHKMHVNGREPFLAHVQIVPGKSCRPEDLLVTAQMWRQSDGTLLDVPGPVVVIERPLTNVLESWWPQPLLGRSLPAGENERVRIFAGHVDLNDPSQAIVPIEIGNARGFLRIVVQAGSPPDPYAIHIRVLKEQQQNLGH